METISKYDIRRAMLFVPKAGGELTVTTSEGEVLFVHGLQPGRYQGTEFAPFMSNTDSAAMSKGMTALVKGSRLNKQPHPESRDMGANPEFTPRRMSDFEAQMLKQMKALEKRSDAAERMLRTAEKNAEKAPKEEPVEVLEAEAEAKPEEATVEPAAKE